MDNDKNKDAEDLRLERRREQIMYEEQLEDNQREQNKVDEYTQELAQQGSYWLKRISPESDNHEAYRVAQKYENKALDELQQQRRKLTSDHELKDEKLAAEIRRLDK